MTMKAELAAVDPTEELQSGGCGELQMHLVEHYRDLEPYSVVVDHRGSLIVMHAVVRTADGRYLDSQGVRTMEDLKGDWGYDIQILPTEQDDDMYVGLSTCYAEMVLNTVDIMERHGLVVKK